MTKRRYSERHGRGVIFLDKSVVADPMLDVYRFFLALAVVQGHLSEFALPWLAWQSVFGFYVLSGFLMTLILNENYGFGPFGFFRFWVNRFLRLLPSYYLILAITLLYIVLGTPLDQLNGALRSPTTAAGWFNNLTIFGLTGIVGTDAAAARLVPTAWSLSIELVCYFLLAVYFAKSTRRLFALFLFGATVTIIHFVRVCTLPVPADFGFQDHYVVWQAGLIPFALGGLTYHYRHIFKPSLLVVTALFALLLLNALLGAVSDFHRYVSGLYISMMINAVLVPTLFRGASSAPWQATLGRMAYPVFISHWLVGTLVFLAFDVRPMGPAHFLMSVTATLAVSFLLANFVDRRVDVLRSFVKNTSASGAYRHKPMRHEPACAAEVASGRSQTAPRH
jgi:peptidoglycan/LPS O-acetylase OafA/YrhL